MKIFIFTGPTASGVTTLSDMLLYRNDDMLTRIVSFTTRKMLPNEKNGREYFFISQDQYLQLRVGGQIAQEFSYLGNHYGITKASLEEFNNSRKNGLAAMGMPGIEAIKQFSGDENVISIFVYRDLNAIREEIEQRDISADEKKQRFELAKKEMLDIGKTNYVIYNLGSFNDLYQEAFQLIRSEINRRS